MRVPDLMIGSLLLAAHITACLHSNSAIAIPHIQQQSLLTLQSTQSLCPSSLHLQLLIPGTLNATVGTHSLHSTITLRNHTVLLWPITVDSLNTSQLHCLNYTDWLPYWHWLGRSHWLVLLTTDYWLSNSILTGIQLTAFSLVGWLI
jgi:hypothetical protein